MVRKIKFKYCDQVITYLNTIEPQLKLDNFKIQIETEATDLDSIARVEPNIYEKILYIQYSKKCNDKTWNEIKNITIHELIHGLYAYHKAVASQCNSSEAHDYQEEMFINHLTEVLVRLLE